jgi:hypothetical protein
MIEFHVIRLRMDVIADCKLKESQQSQQRHKAFAYYIKMGQ